MSSTPIRTVRLPKKSVEASLRSYIEVHPRYYAQDLPEYEKYAEHDGWDFNALYSSKDGKERAAAFLDNFYHSGYSPTVMSSSNGPITVEKLMGFLQKLIERNPQVAQMEISTLNYDGYDEFDNVQLITDEDGEEHIAFTAYD